MIDRLFSHICDNCDHKIEFGISGYGNPVEALVRAPLDAIVAATEPCPNCGHVQDTEATIKGVRSMAQMVEILMNSMGKSFDDTAMEIEATVPMAKRVSPTAIKIDTSME